MGSDQTLRLKNIHPKETSRGGKALQFGGGYSEGKNREREGKAGKKPWAVQRGVSHAGG